MGELGKLLWSTYKKEIEKVKDFFLKVHPLRENIQDPLLDLHQKSHCICGFLKKREHMVRLVRFLFFVYYLSHSSWLAFN